MTVFNRCGLRQYQSVHMSGNWQRVTNAIWHVLCAVLLIGAVGIPLAPEAIAASADGPTTPGQTLLGAYIGDPGDPHSPWEPNLITFTSAMGQPPKIVLQYTDFNYVDWKDLERLASGTLVPNMKRSAKLKDMVPMIGLFLATRATNAATSYTNLAAGKYDSYLVGFINAYKKAGFTQVYLRPGWEMNGTWFPWLTNTPELQRGFVSAWRRLYTVVKSVTGINVTVIWNPTANTSDYMSIYPGDRYVDMIGIDTGGYYFANVASDQPLDTQTFSVATAARMCRERNKPMSFPEIYDLAVMMDGTINKTETQVFLNNVIQALRNNPGVYVHDVEIWSDISGSDNGSSRWADQPDLVPIWRSFWDSVQSLPPP
jgi:hypothetical protein